MAKKKKKTAKKKPQKRVTKAARRVTRPPKRKAVKKKAKGGTNRRPESRALKPAAAPPPPPQSVIMEFTKDENSSPHDVRVTLSKPTHVALPLGYPTGKSDPRAPDSKVPATIFVMVPDPAGGKRTATIAVTNSWPSVLRVTVPEGNAQATEVTELTVRREEA